MAKIFITTLPDGHRMANLAIIEVSELGEKLQKAMFELSRDGSDMTTDFDPAIHTLDTISAGISGHLPLTCRESDKSDLPAEQALRGIEPTFRDAWEDTGVIVRVNMLKARAIHMSHIRKVRNAELENESGSRFRQPIEIETLFTVERQRRLQALRDIPQTFDLTQFQTPEALKAAWPVELSR